MKTKSTPKAKRFYASLFFASVFIICLAFMLTAPACDRYNPPSEPVIPPTPTDPEEISNNVFIWGHEGIPDEYNTWMVVLLARMKKDIRFGLKKTKPDLKDMILIKKGPAVIGCDKTPRAPDDCLPLETRVIGDFYIDRVELSNALYDVCVAEQACLPAPHMDWPHGKDPDRPALLSPKQAERYCLWAGKRLPTEYEWEKAARGADGRIYPWGNGEPTAQRANICGEACPMPYADKDWNDGYGHTNPVDAFPGGDSPYGVRNMAGNVKEWVSSDVEKRPNYYIARGASWYSTNEEAVAIYRQTWFPTTRIDDKGVRCVADK